MSLSHGTCWCEALKLLPARWRADACRFVKQLDFPAPPPRSRRARKPRAPEGRG